MALLLARYLLLIHYAWTKISKIRNRKNPRLSLTIYRICYMQRGIFRQINCCFKLNIACDHLKPDIILYKSTPFSQLQQVNFDLPQYLLKRILPLKIKDGSKSPHPPCQCYGHFLPNFSNSPCFPKDRLS